MAEQSRTRMGLAMRGFTLVELVIVIALLGVLAAVALPRWANLEGEARAAKADGLASAIRSAATQVKSVSVSRGVSCGANVAAASSPVLIEGARIGLRFCYPVAPTLASAPAGTIIQAANINTLLDGVTLFVSGVSPDVSVDVRVVGATDPNTCYARYTAPTVALGGPTVTVVKTGC